MKKEDLGAVVRALGEIHTEDMEIRHVLEKQFVQPLIGTTPSVLNRKIFELTNTAPLTITDFADGALGQRIYILGDGSTTIANNATIKTNTGASKLLAVNKVYTFTFFGTPTSHKWVEDVDEAGSGGGGGITGLPAVSIGAGTNKLVNTTSYADVDNTRDIVIPAAIGDKLLVSVSCMWSNVANWADLDVATIVAGAVVNYISGYGPTGAGVLAWRGLNSALNWPFGGSLIYVVVAGDIEGGNVRLRLRAKSISRTLFVGLLNFGTVNLLQ